jgi:hypothetical protein
MEEVRDILLWRDKMSFTLLQVSQDSPARPCDRDSKKVKKLQWL